MSSENLVLRLPVIDFSNQELKPGTPEWDVLKIQVRQALEVYGCFEASFDRILEVRKPLFGALEEFFDLPLQTKKLCVSESLTGINGYHGANAPLRETMSYQGGNVAQDIEQQVTNIAWPQGNSSFSKILLSFSELAFGLEKVIRRMILESFGLDKYADEYTDFANYSMRLMKAEPQKANPNLIPHYDLGLLTLLYENEVGGLEIQNKDGKWLKLKSSPNSLIVMVGESLGVWLNGGLSAPYHRVITAGNTKTRYSLGVFTNPKGGYKMKVPQELVNQENPLLFKPFHYEEFMGAYFSHSQLTRQASLLSLKTYCAI